MAVLLKIGLVGDKELIRKLMALDNRVRGDVSRKTIGVGMTPVIQAMRKTVPVGATGNLRRSLGKKTKQYRSGVTIGVVGPRLPMGAHAHFTESGTQERVVQKTGRRVGRVKAQFWMRRAFDASASSAANRMVAYLSARLRRLGV